MKEKELVNAHIHSKLINAKKLRQLEKILVTFLKQDSKKYLPMILAELHIKNRFNNNYSMLLEINA